MVVMNWRRQEPRGNFAKSILHLLGHILGSACIFVFLATVEWGLEWFVATLNEVRPLDQEDFLLVHHVGQAFLWGDVSLSAIVFITGFVKFVRDLWS